MTLDPTIAEISHWVTDQALTDIAPEALVEGICLRLNNAGVSVFRANVAIRPIHPLHGALAYRWNRLQGAECEVFDNASLEVAWTGSPYYHMHRAGLTEMRHSLSDTSQPDAFAMFGPLREQGGTDYFAAAISFDPGTGPDAADPDQPRNTVRFSWVSDAAEGFSDTDLAALRQVMSPLALALAAKTAQRVGRDLLAIYLGADAGRRVLSGEIGHGSVTSLQTAILYLDLSGFTELSERLPGQDIIAMLNDYFAAIVPTIERHGGQVLKFMGDGLLAIFSDGSKGMGRMHALDAVSDVEVVVNDVSAQRQAAGLPATGFTSALHAGEVLYGNIGAPERLDFTVIGPAVNIAARMLEMCKALDRRILVSEAVARPALETYPRLLSLGQYGLRGVRGRQELFTLE
ncbi:adenylate/guanylate cyclase domain-containing protein [Aestuariivita boseongensis]|uniref:adenylate/guanylate cyclase domain-containing protein n=1 Tax=Aestuariivita boseongensis TaxID=1470562 RepID=UPI0006818FD8|nr:adenylate/guanylate cyclase domain-containing protein [Aestuariivita boseongensis]